MGKRSPLKMAPRAKMTGGEVLSMVTGAAEAKPKEESKATTALRRMRAKPEKQPAPSPRPAEMLEQVLFRLRADQRQAIRQEAMKRAEERGRGSPDQSAVVREFFDACFGDWMAKK